MSESLDIIGLVKDLQAENAEKGGWDTLALAKHFPSIAEALVVSVNRLERMHNYRICPECGAEKQLSEGRHNLNCLLDEDLSRIRSLPSS